VTYKRKTAIPYADRVAVSPHVAAELAGVPVRHVYAAIRAGQLKAWRGPGLVRWHVLVADIGPWIETTFKPVPPQPVAAT
jgi:hypothetical protein